MSTEPERRAAVTVIGIGNPMRRDDGVGLAVVARLAAEGVGAGDVDFVELDGEPTRLIEAWRDRRRVIVVDAVRSGADTGSIHHVDLRRGPLPGWRSAHSSHASGIAAAVDLGRALDALPDELVLIGVECADVSFGDVFSQEVDAALPAIVDCVRAEVVAWTTALGR